MFHRVWGPFRKKSNSQKQNMRQSRIWTLCILWALTYNHRNRFLKTAVLGIFQVFNIFKPKFFNFWYWYYNLNFLTIIFFKNCHLNRAQTKSKKRCVVFLLFQSWEENWTEKNCCLINHILAHLMELSSVGLNQCRGKIYHILRCSGSINFASVNFDHIITQFFTQKRSLTLLDSVWCQLLQIFQI